MTRKILALTIIAAFTGLLTTDSQARPGDEERAKKRQAETLEACDKVDDDELKSVCKEAVSRDKKAGGCFSGKFTNPGCGKKIAKKLKKAAQNEKKYCGRLEGKDGDKCRAIVRGDCVKAFKADPSFKVDACAMKAAEKADVCRDPAFKKEGRALQDEMREACGTVLQVDWEDAKHIERYIKSVAAAKAGLANLASYDDKWAQCINNSRARNRISSGSRRSWGRCLGEYAERWSDGYSSMFKRYNKDMKELPDVEKRKAWRQAKDEAKRHLEYMQKFQPAADAIGSAEEKAAVGKAITDLKAKEKKYAGAEFAALKAKRCPKGKNRKGSLEKKLKRVYGTWAKEHMPGKSKLKQLRMNGKIFKEVLINGRRETANTIVCYKRPDKKQEPGCHYEWLSFQRTKPNGGRWGAWEWGGVGENGPLFCNNVNR